MAHEAGPGTTSATSARQFEKVCAILEKFNYDEVSLVPILQAVQEHYRYLPQEIMTFIATSLHVPPSRVFGVATFYSHFALEPKGKYVVRVCDGTACHVKGSTILVDTLREYLKVTEKNKTTHDMLFTVETVSCLGACGLAPVMVVNEEVYSQVTAEKAKEIIRTIEVKEKGHEN